MQKVNTQDGSFQPSCQPGFMTPQYLGKIRKSDPKRVKVRTYDTNIANEKSPHIYIKSSHILLLLWEELMSWKNWE